ncbi:unnamed protein product, partial [Amoebophrya sp. A25]
EQGTELAALAQCLNEEAIYGRRAVCLQNGRPVSVFFVRKGHLLVLREITLELKEDPRGPDFT